MADSDPKASPLHEPQSTEGNVYGYNVSEQSRSGPAQKPNPNSPLAAG